jgi:hypothetical protein
MPQALPFIFAALVNYGYYYAAAVVFVAMMASNAYERRKAARQARDAYNASLQDRLVMTMTVDGPRSRVYGEVRTVDGVLFHATHGSLSEKYVLVVAFAGHECQEIGQIYFDDVPVAFDGSGWITPLPPALTSQFIHYERATGQADITLSGGNGSVVLPQTPLTATVTFDLGNDNGTVTTTPSISGNTVTVTGWGSTTGTAKVDYEYTVSTPRVRLLQKYLGTAGQDIGSDHLQSRFPSLINTGANDDRFAGICCAVFEFDYDQDIFPTGVPQITAVIKGAKILDPRTSTTAWSQNAALIGYDWARYAYGGACATTEIITAQVNAAANACDVSTTFNLAGGGSEVRPLYQCGIVCSLDVNPDVWMDEIVESMAGRWGWAGGKIAMVAGAYRAPVETITEDWISDQGDIEIVPQPSRSELVNVYRPSFFDAAQAYVQAPGAEIRSSSYITIDGQELPREVTLGGVTRAVHAGHVCGVLMRDQREGMVAKLPCNMRAFKMELFDVVNVTLPHFGWSAKVFEIVGWAFDMTKALVTLTLKETDASVYTVDSSFSTPNSSNNTLLPAPWVVPTPTGLSVTSGTTALSDGSIITRTEVTWTATTSEAVRQSGKIEVQYVEAADTLPSAANWASWIEEGSATKAVIPGLRAKRHYLFRVRAINTLGVRSAWGPLYVHQIGQPPLVQTGGIAVNAATEFNSAAQPTRTCKLRSDTGATVTPPYEANSSGLTVDVLTLSYTNNTGAAVSVEVTGSFVCKLSHTSGTNGNSYGFIRTRLSATISAVEYGESAAQPMASDVGLTEGLLFSRSPVLQLISVPNGSTLSIAIVATIEWKSGTPTNVGDLIAEFNDLTIRYAALKR